MPRSLFIPSVVLAAAAASAVVQTSALAEKPDPRSLMRPGDLIARPGAFEFSGRVIARPRPIPDPPIADGGLPPTPVVRHAALIARLNLCATGGVQSTDELLLKVPKHTADADYIRHLRDSGEFLSVEPDWLCHPADGSNDPLLLQQWPIRTIQADTAWSVTRGTPDVIVAVVDSGVDIWHNDLTANLVLPGHNSVGQSPLAPPSGVYTDISMTGHGTRCVGLIAAVADNNLGIAGIAPGVRVLPVRCTNSPTGSALLSDILNGAEWAARNGAKVVSVSFNGVANATVGLRGSVIRSLNSMLVFAAGNSNSSISAAADWPDVLIVGAIDQSDSRYTLSNYGPAVDAVAPGVDVLTTIPGNQFQTSTGTSFATPQAAAVAALIWSHAPQLQSSDVESILVASCIDIGPAGKDDEFGLGRVNAQRAMRWLTMPGGLELPAMASTPQWPGLTARYYQITVTGNAPPDFSTAMPRISIGIANPNFPPGTLAAPAAGSGFGATFTGAIVVPATNIYTFEIDAVDSARLFIDGLLVINNAGTHELQTRIGSVYLESGAHDLRIEYATASPEGGLVLKYRSTPGLATPVPDSWLVRDLAGVDVVDIADFSGLPGHNGSVDEGDYNLFFQVYFSDDPVDFLRADIADDIGMPMPDGHVNEGDFNAFFFWFFR